MTAGVDSPPSVAAVIVTHDRLEQLRQTLARTLALPFARVVVVDNASGDGTAEFLAGQDDPRLHVLREAENRGGAGGFARGFEAVAQAGEIEWLVCYDDDAYPQADALQAFAALAPDSGVGAVAAAVRLPDGGISSMNRPGINPFWSPGRLWRAVARRTNRFGVPDAAYAGPPRPVDYASFVGLFVRCALVRGPLGLPRAELFIYGDDALYTLSIRRLGHALLFAPRIRFVHDCATTPGRHRVFEPLWRAYYAIRNGLVFYRALSGACFYPVMAPLLLAFWFASAWRYPDRRRFWRVARAAVMDGLRQDCSRPHRDVLRLAAARGGSTGFEGAPVTRR